MYSLESLVSNQYNGKIFIVRRNDCKERKDQSSNIKTNLKDHQKICINWLIKKELTTTNKFNLAEWDH